jgi:hypothetical protein
MTTQNDYNHNYINKKVSIAIHEGVPVTRYGMDEIFPSRKLYSGNAI